MSCYTNNFIKLTIISHYFFLYYYLKIYNNIIIYILKKEKKGPFFEQDCPDLRFGRLREVLEVLGWCVR